jgi:hypothetical protein
MDLSIYVTDFIIRKYRLAVLTILVYAALC